MRGYRASLDGAKVERLYVVEKLSLKEIGERFGYKPGTIAACLDARNVPRRLGVSQRHKFKKALANVQAKQEQKDGSRET